MRLFLAVSAAVPIGLAMCALAAPVRAQEGAAIADVLVVRHGIASGCPGGSALAARIDAIAGRPATGGPDVADTRLAVTFSPRPGGGLGATLEATGARSGQRTFEDADLDCAPLAEAVAVAAALLLDAGWNAPPPPASPAAPPGDPRTSPTPPAPAPPAPPTPPPPVAPTNDAAKPGSVDASGAPFFSWGAPAWAFDGWVSYSTVVDAAGGPALALMARRRFGPASVGAGGTFAFPRTDVQTRTSGSVSAWALGLVLEGCLDVSAKPLDTTISPCATSSLRWVIASGSGYAEASTGTQPMVGLGGALVLARRLVGPLGLVVRGGAEGHVVRPSFIVDQLGGAAGAEVGEAYEPPVLGVDVGGGVRIELP